MRSGGVRGGAGVGGDRGSVMGPGAVHSGSMEEARVRFLTAVKAHCTERYKQGWLSSTGLRVLKVSRGRGGEEGGGANHRITVCAW